MKSVKISQALRISANIELVTSRFSYYEFFLHCGPPTLSVVSAKVSSLNPPPRQTAEHLTSTVAKSFLPSAEESEVFAQSWSFVRA